MISIVTGTLNRRNFLPGLIENTVLSDDRLELVLVDGGSEDGTIEYIKSLNHERIKLIEIGHRSPYPHYMNIGIRESKYEWVAQWNDDVMLLDSWDMVIKELEEDYDLYIYKWIQAQENDLVDLEKRDWIQFELCMNFGIYHTRVFRKIGLYDEKFHYYHCDQDMTRRALMFGMTCKYSNVRVQEIMTEKRAITQNDDNKLIEVNLKRYKKKKLPVNISFLRDQTL